MRSFPEYLTFRLQQEQSAAWAGMEQCGVLPESKGIAMHDCWASYWNYPDIQHAVCCAYLLRGLTGIDENHPEQKWASAVIDLLLEMKKVKDKAVEITSMSRLITTRQNVIFG